LPSGGKKDEKKIRTQREEEIWGGRNVAGFVLRHTRLCETVRGKEVKSRTQRGFNLPGKASCPRKENCREGVAKP